MELHQLRYFVAVAEHKSFRAAAEHCRVSQPSLSQQIMKLERLLRRQLFDRLGRGVEITEAGEVLLPRAREILAQVRLATHEVAQNLEVGRGRLAIGALPTIAPYLLPPVLQRFRAVGREVDLELLEDVTPSLVAELAAARLDLAIMSLPLESEQIDYEELMYEPFLAVDRPGGPLASIGGHGVTLEAVREQPAIVLHEVHCMGRQTRCLCVAEDQPPRIVCRTSQLSTVLSLVSLGLGVSLVPRMCAANDLSTQRVYRPLTDVAAGRAIVAVWRAGRTRSTLIESFLEDLREVCRGFEAAERDPHLRSVDIATASG